MLLIDTELLPIFGEWGGLRDASIVGKIVR